MAKRPNRKQKRPLAEGVVPPEPVPRRRRRELKLSPRGIRRTAPLVGLLTPVLLIGLMTVATNPDYEILCFVCAFFLMVGGVIGLAAVRSSGWFGLAAIGLGLVMVIVPTGALHARLLLHRGVETQVVVTAVHSSKGRGGMVSWQCDLRRADGRPLPHGTVGGSGCGAWSLGSTMTVLADPDDWTAPAGTDEDLAFRSTGLYFAGAAALLWPLLTLLAARRSLRDARVRDGWEHAA